MAGKKFSDIFKTSNTANVADTDLFALERADGNTYIVRANTLYNYVSTRIANGSVLTVGNTTVNTQINSTTISVRAIRANGTIGTAGQILASNGSGLYWTSAGSGSPGGSNTEIQFNDSGTFSGSNNFTFNNSQNKLAIGNTTVNTQINSTSIVLTSLIANGSVGSTGDVLYSNGSTLYWAAPSGGGGLLSGNGLTSNTTHIEVLANSGIVANSTGTFVNSAYIATLDANNSAFLGNIPAANYAVLSSTTSTFTGNLAANNAETLNHLNVGGNLTVEGNVFITGSVVSLLGNTSTFVDNMIFLNQGIEATITNVSGSGTVVTFTANNNFFAGWDVLVNSVNPVSYNGLYTNILAANATHFQVSNTNVQPYVSGGTARGKSDANPDLGVAAAYNDGTYRHTGIFRDASDSYWKIFDGYLPEPDDSIFINTSDPSFNIASFWAGSIRLGNTSVYSTVNTTIYEGTANNANNLGGVSLSTLQNQITGNSTTAYTNAVTDAATSAAGLYQTTAGLAANVTTLTANNALNLGGTAAANYVNTSGAFTLSGVQTFNANVFVNNAVLSVGNTTTNVTSNTTVIRVGNGVTFTTINSTAFSGTAANITGVLGYSSLPANVVIWSNTNTFTAVQNFNANVSVNTTSRLAVGNDSVNVAITFSNVFVSNTTRSTSVLTGFIQFDGTTTVNATNYTGTSSNATNLNSQPGTFYTNATNINTGTLPWAQLNGNTVNTSGNFVIAGTRTHNANVFVNTAVLSVGNTTANVTTNTTHIVVGNASINVSINSTAFSGTANNASNFNSQPASFYTNATNLATGTVPTARLATSGTASGTTFLRGDQVWATPPGGGGGSPGGATADIQFNDAGSFTGNSNFTYDQAAVRLTVGNTTVNTQINSTSIALRTLIANGGVGSAGQVLTSSGTGANLYWSTVSGGGGEVVSSVSSNTSMAAPTTFYLVSGNVTMTLPTSVGNSGLKFQVKNNGTGTITIDTTSSQTIDGNINMLVTEQNSVIGLIADGSNWNIF